MGWRSSERKEEMSEKKTEGAGPRAREARAGISEVRGKDRTVFRSSRTGDTGREPKKTRGRRTPRAKDVLEGRWRERRINGTDLGKKQQLPLERERKGRKASWFRPVSIYLFVRLVASSPLTDWLTLDEWEGGKKSRPLPTHPPPGPASQNEITTMPLSNPLYPGDRPPHTTWGRGERTGRAGVGVPSCITGGLSLMSQP